MRAETRAAGRYPVELLDAYIRLQKVANDHQIRGVVSFAGQLDIEKLRIAIRRSFAYAPILACRYVRERDTAYWEEAEFPDEAFFHVMRDDGDHGRIVECLHDAPRDDGPQLSVHVIRRDASDSLVIVVNHMAFDGAGFKSYLYLLARLYSGDQDGTGSLVEKGNMERGMRALLENVPTGRKVLSLFRRTLSSAGNDLMPDASGDGETRLRLCTIDQAKFKTLKEFCARSGITVNDLILALFAFALFTIGATRRAKTGRTRVAIQVMFDLRRYLGDSAVSQFANFSSMESLVLRDEGRDFPALAGAIHETMARMKKRSPGLKNILVMNALFEILPRRTFDAMLSRTIRSLGVSTSNLGVIDEERLKFKDVDIADAYMLASIKKQPAMQLSFSTFRDGVTMSVLGKYSPRNWAVVQGLMDAMCDEIDRLCRGLPADT
jgi:NRPS condensation-like uncharacterized protein